MKFYKFPLSIFFCLIFSFSFSQFYPEDIPTLQRIIKNKIKTEFVYKDGGMEFVNRYAKNGRKIGFEKYGKDGKIISKYVWNLDSTGRRVTGEHLINDSLYRRHIFIYDSKGNCVEAIKSEPQGGLMERGYHYTYDKNNRLVEEEHKLLDGTTDTKISYKYNENGKLSEQQIFKGKSTQSKRLTFSYTGSGLLKESILYETDGALTLKYVAEYDTRGNLTKGLSFQFDPQAIRDKDGKLLKGNEYQGENIIYNTYLAVYDEKNNITESKDLDTEGNQKHERTYQYEYYP